jgi:hypothetical protein
VIDECVTGFIVDTLEEAVRAVENVASLSRQRCREVFQERFSAARMAHDYVTLYRHLVEARPVTVSTLQTSLLPVNASPIDLDAQLWQASPIER